jgi:two-component system response regulator AtoC
VIDEEWLPAQAAPGAGAARIGMGPEPDMGPATAPAALAAPAELTHAALAPQAPVGEDRIVVEIGSQLADVERRLILATYERCGRHKERTAALLGISMKTLYNRLKEYQQ